MTYPDRPDDGDDVTVRRPQVDWRADTTRPRRDTIAWVPGGPPPAPPRRRGRLVVIVVAIVVVVLVAAGAVVFLVVRGGSDGTPTARPSRTATASGSGSATLAASDALVASLTVGECLAMSYVVTDTIDPDATVVGCTDPTATFTVADLNRRVNAANPCHSDASVRSAAAGRVICLTRFLQKGQCVLGNDANPYLLTAIDCAASPPAPFTRVLRIEQYRQGSPPLTCTAPLLLANASPDRTMCLSTVR